MVNVDFGHSRVDPYHDPREPQFEMGGFDGRYATHQPRWVRWGFGFTNKITQTFPLQGGGSTGATKQDLTQLPNMDARGSTCDGPGPCLWG